MADSEINYYHEFLAEFLPELDFHMSDIASALAKLEELRDFYERRGHPLESYRNMEGRTIVLPMGTTDWETEVKSSILFVDHVICDDPLLYIADSYVSSIDDKQFMKRFIWYDYDAACLDRLRGALNAIWRIQPLLQTEALIFQYLRVRPTRQRAIEHAVRSYLDSDMQITRRNEPGTYPYWVDFHVPLLDFNGTAEISRGLLKEDILEKEQVLRQHLPSIVTHALSTIEGLRAADVVAGTLWTSSDWIWKLSRDAVGSLSQRARIYSFIHDFQRPVLETVSAASLASLRANDEVMYTFRRELRLAEGLITCDPDDVEFEDQVRQAFCEVFKPSLENIERSMKRNRAFTQLPWFAASTGFAYAATVAAPGPALPGIFSAISAAAGFSGLFKTLFDPEAPVRREPAFVLWKVAKLAGGPTVP